MLDPPMTRRRPRLHAIPRYGRAKKNTIRDAPDGVFVGPLRRQAFFAVRGFLAPK